MICPHCSSPVEPLCTCPDCAFQAPLGEFDFALDEFPANFRPWRKPSPQEIRAALTGALDARSLVLGYVTPEGQRVTMAFTGNEDPRGLILLALTALQKNQNLALDKRKGGPRLKSRKVKP